MVGDYSITSGQKASLVDWLSEKFGLNQEVDNSVSTLKCRKIFSDALIAFALAVNSANEPESIEDGFGMLSHQTISDAAEVLCGILPDVSLPIIVALPGRGLGFQWNGLKNEIITISVFGTGMISYAGVFSDTHRLKGTCPVTHPIAVELAALLKKHFPNTDLDGVLSEQGSIHH